MINQGLTNSFFDLILPIIRGRVIWIPLYVILCYALYKSFGKIGFALILVALLNSATADITSSRIIKNSVERARPCHTFQSVEDITLRVRCGRGYSFTSSHATNHFAIALFFAMVFSKRWIYLTLIAWAASISFAQVYVGVHYPLDVISGTILGSLIGIIFGKVGKHIIKKYIYNSNINTV